MTSILDFLTNVQLLTLRDIEHSRATPSIKALIARGLVYRDESGKHHLTTNGGLALRELEQRDGLRPVFKVGQRVEFVNWHISREEWIAEVHAGIVTGSNIYGVNIADDREMITSNVSHYRVFRSYEPLAPQPVQEHPAIVALRGMDIDAMDPITALVKLYELKRMAGQA